MYMENFRVWMTDNVDREGKKSKWVRFVFDIFIPGEFFHIVWIFVREGFVVFILPLVCQLRSEIVRKLLRCERKIQFICRKMSGKPQLTKDPVWQKIFAYFTANGTKINIKEMFDKDPKRFEKYRYFFFSSLLIKWLQSCIGVCIAIYYESIYQCGW